MSAIRNDISRLDALAGPGAQLAAVQTAPGAPQAFSDFTGFASEGSVRLGLSGASLDPLHAARAVVGFIAEG